MSTTASKTLASLAVGITPAVSIDSGHVVISKSRSSSQWDLMEYHPARGWCPRPTGPAPLEILFREIGDQIRRSGDFTLFREELTDSDFQDFDPNIVRNREVCVLCPEGREHSGRWVELILDPVRGVINRSMKDTAFMSIRRRLDEMMPDIKWTPHHTQATMTSAPSLAKMDFWVRRDLTASDFLPSGSA